MTELQPSEAEVLTAALKRGLRGVHTSLPGKVVSYDSATQTANVQLTVDVETKSGTFEMVPPLQDVPIAHPVSASFYAHFPLAAGDALVVLFFEADPSEWLAAGNSGAPPMRGRHGFYAVAFPGVPPESARLASAEAPAGKAVWGARGGAVVTASSSAVQLGSTTATDAVVLESKIQAAVADACDAAVGAALPEDGGKLAFTTFKSNFAAALIGALKVVGE